ncbi:hypothetical protein CSUI_003452 [Cystoisospora suis]|uniref:Uncharacterized protein n=1 Tax=Cystoisospora suis TaxID=483139 RepID=A0A2C6KFA7_9APIC|nr:hypothetical protein CSUI_003452 [Cystoisospora suis]
MKRRKHESILCEAVDGQPLCVSAGFCPFSTVPSVPLSSSSSLLRTGQSRTQRKVSSASERTHATCSPGSEEPLSGGRIDRAESLSKGVEERANAPLTDCFDEKGNLQGCKCFHLSKDPRIKFKSIETIARERGNTHCKTYVFTSDTSSTLSSGSSSSSSSSSEKAVLSLHSVDRGNASSSLSPSSSTSQSTCDSSAPTGIPLQPTRESGGHGYRTRSAGEGRCGASKAKELRESLRNLPGNKRFICGRNPLRRMANDNVDKWLDMHVAVPMRACDRVAGSPKRTVREELILALEEGVVHDLIQPAEITDANHHVKRILNWAQACTDPAGVIGCLWKGPYVGFGETLVAGIYAGEVRAGGEAQGVENQETLKTTPDYSFDCGWRDMSFKFVATEDSRKLVRFHTEVASYIRQQNKNKRRKKGTPEKVVPKPVVAVEEIGLQPDGTVVLPDDQYLCLDSSRYFNQMSLINDNRDILGQRRLKANMWIYELHFEGFPFFVFMKRMESDLRHMEECLVNCGPLYRFNHLQPLCEEAFSRAIARKPEKDSEEEKARTVLLMPWWKFEHRDDLCDSLHSDERTVTVLKVHSEKIWESDDDLGL